MKYTGEGSIEEPAFPLEFIHASGAITTCHNEADLNEAMRDENRQMAAGLVCGLAIAVPLALGVVALAYWFTAAS